MIGGARCIPVPEFLAARERGDAAVERAFFENILLRNGVFKTTAAHRMDDLFPALVAAARALPQPIRVLDVACSSGVATREMHQALVDAGLAVETIGTDLALHATYARRDDGCAMLFDSRGELLQVEIGNWASPWRWRPRDLALRPWLALRARQLVARELDDFREGRACKVEPIELLAGPAVGAPGLRFEEEDILAPRVPGSFGIVRAANLLNPSYFTPEQLRPMIAALCARLAEGGLLLVNRTDSAGVNRATIFVREGGRMRGIAQVNGGSEVAALV